MIIVIFIPVYWVMEPARQKAALSRQHDEAVARGAELFTSNCAACHGSHGEGNIGPVLRGTQLDENILEKMIARGIPGTAMAAWSDEEGGFLKNHNIKDLVTFIKDWDDTLSGEPVSTPQETPAAETITGGELFSASCVACHGVNRQGISGLGPAVTPDSLSALSDDETKDTILNGRTGTVMPAFESTLTSEEIDVLLQFIKYTSP